MKKLRNSIVSGLLAVGTSGPVAAFAQDSGGFQGRLDFGVRAYGEDGDYAGQKAAGADPFVGIGLSGQFGVGAGSVVLQYEGLLDEKNGRTSSNVQKLYYQIAFDSFEVLAGINTENWGVSEGHSILNVLNPVNSIQPSNQEQIGTPMVKFSFDTQVGTFDAYALIGFVHPTFGTSATRERGVFETDTAYSVFEGSATDVDVALRWRNDFTFGAGSLDMQASVFQGTNRNPVMIPGCIFGAGCAGTNAGSLNTYLTTATPYLTPKQLIAQQVAATGATTTSGIATSAAGFPTAGFFPYYQDITRFGLGAVYAFNDWQFRYEGTFTVTQFDDYYANVIGGDYTFNNFAGTAGTLVAALEYHRDARSSMQPFNPFDNDVFFGFDYAFNDTRDMRIKFGGFQDLDNQARIMDISVSGRVTDRIRAELGATGFNTKGLTDPLSFVEQDGFVEFKLSTFF